MQTMQDFTAAVVGGRIFTVTFVKRTTGELRTMNCRVGVKKHLAGGELAYDPAKVSLLPVYDLQSEGYRMIALDGITEVKLGGQRYAWVSDHFEQVLA